MPQEKIIKSDLVQKFIFIRGCKSNTKAPNWSKTNPTNDLTCHNGVNEWLKR